MRAREIRRSLAGALCALALAGAARAGVELVTLPGRDGVQLTIYREVDLTLVRERRTLTFRPGTNRLEFSWAGTLIDPTSLELRPARAGGLEVLDASFPPRVSKTLVWTVEVERGGPQEVEISYFTSGVAWKASYQAIAAPDGRSMDLEGDVHITNHSGEDFEGASVRLVVGHVNLVESIRSLAQKNEARAKNGRHRKRPQRAALRELSKSYVDKMSRFTPEEKERLHRSVEDLSEAKQILKQGLADYFLFAVPGREDVPNGWTVRLPSVRAQGVPFHLLYKHRPRQFGARVKSFLKLHNTEASKLGTEPLPAGGVEVFRRLEGGDLVHVGASQSKYIPVNEKVELDLGADPEVRVEVLRMQTRTDSYQFETDGDVGGWDEHLTERVTIDNGRPYPIEVELWRWIPEDQWRYSAKVAWTKHDGRTVKTVRKLGPGASDRFEYTVTTGKGDRRHVRR